MIVQGIQYQFSTTPLLHQAETILKAAVQVTNAGFEKNNVLTHVDDAVLTITVDESTMKGRVFALALARMLEKEFDAGSFQVEHMGVVPTVEHGPSAESSALPAS